MTDGQNQSYALNSLEVLATLYADQRNINLDTFSEYIDTRFEDTLNILRRSAIKSFEEDTLGDSMYGVVLEYNSQPGDRAAHSPEAPTSDILAVMGMVRPTALQACRVMALGSDHTLLHEVPSTYGNTPIDRSIIKGYPLFYYSPAQFPLIPGSFVECRFDKNSYQMGIITGHDSTMPPYVLNGEMYTPLSSMPAFGGSADLSAFLQGGGGRELDDPPAVIKRARELGFDTWTTPYRLWLYGIRSTGRTADSYDDELGVVYVDAEDKWRHHIWPGTTDPGYKSLLLEHESLKGAKQKGGTAILVPGQYLDTYKIDKHGKYKYLAMCQRAGRVSVYRDPSEDKTLDLDPATIDKGWFGINIHASVSKGTPINASRVGLQSAGCQVHSTADGFQNMMALGYQQIQQTGRRTFSYTLLDEWRGGAA